MEAGASRPTKPRRASRFTRADHPPPFRLTGRDIDVVESVNACRILSQSQVQRLHFPSKNTAQVRLNHLWQHCYLRRLYSMGFVTAEALYALDRRGVELLQLERGLGRQQIRPYRATNLNPLTLEHTLSLNDVRIAAQLSAHCHQFNLTQWRDDLDAKADFDRVQLGQHLVPILPDAYFVVRAGREDYHFFMEYDTGREGLTTIERKLRAYQVYIGGGKCERRFGTSKVRVLFVVRGQAKRLDHLRGLAQPLPYAGYFWLSSYQQATTADFLAAPVWFSGQKESPAPLIVPTLTKAEKPQAVDRLDTGC